MFLECACHIFALCKGDLTSETKQENNTSMEESRPRYTSEANKNPARFVNAICEAYDDDGAVENLCDTLKDRLDGVNPELVVVFASAPRHFEFPDLLPKIHSQLSPSVVVGCSGAGVIGNGLEIEEGPALSIMAARCTPHALHPFSFSDRDACGKDASPDSLLKAIDVEPQDFADGSMLVFVDPLTVSTEYSLSMLDSAYPKIKKFGALVSGGLEYGDNGMFIGDELKRQGAVGLFLSSDINSDTLVSGSETPIGAPMIITASNRNVIHRLADRPPLDVLEDIYQESDEERQLQIKQTLIVGIESDRMSYHSTGSYDFVMRNIMETDNATGAIAIGDLVEDGQAFQFHVRDSRRATDDLRLNLQDYIEKHGDANQGARAALCFNSVTRGTRMFSQKNHDSLIIEDHLGETPLAGIFSNGEIVSKIGGFMDDEHVSKVMGYTDTLVMLSSSPAENEDADDASQSQESDRNRKRSRRGRLAATSTTASRARRNKRRSQENG